MSTCDKRNIIERLMWIYHWLCKEKYTLADLTKSIVSRDWNKEELIFSMGIENGESVYFIDKNETWREEKVTESVEKLFINSFLKDGDNTFVQYCRCIGTWKTEDQKEHKIYYFFSIHHCDGISNLYFQSIDDVYYQWIQSKVNGLMSLVDLPNDLGYEKAFEKRMYRLISDTFYEYMLENYDVDLNVITELAGSYYEGQPCRSKLVFQFGAQIEDKRGVELEQPIEISTGYIRRIRKILQMGQENQYLSIKWSGELKKWMLTGVYSGEVLQHTSFVFKIVSHMTWEMEFAGKKVLCYKCGKYFIDCETFHEERFHIVYKNTFQCDVTEPVKMIFRKAIRQIHGTVLVIWDSQKADDEIKRLKTESTAIELKGRQLCEEYIESVTSIDGALCIDSDGLCYGIGVILDSSIKLQGSAERGSRYNSTKKYVKQCLDKGIACVAVVVSEDQTIDFFWKETFDEEGVTYEQ